MRVYVVTYEMPFEGSVVIGVAKTQDEAKKIAEAYAKKNGKPGNRVRWPQEFADGIWGATTHDDGCGYFIGPWEVQK